MAVNINMTKKPSSKINISKVVTDLLYMTPT